MKGFELHEGGCKRPEGKTGDIAACQDGNWRNLNKGNSTSRVKDSEAMNPRCNNPLGSFGQKAKCFNGLWTPFLNSTRRYGSVPGATSRFSDQNTWLIYGPATNVTLYAGNYRGKGPIILAIQLYYGKTPGRMMGNPQSSTSNETYTLDVNTGVVGCSQQGNDDGYIYRLGFLENDNPKDFFPDEGKTCDHDETNFPKFQLAYIDAYTTDSIVGGVVFYYMNQI